MEVILQQCVPIVHMERVPHGAMAIVLGQMMPASVLKLIVEIMKQQRVLTVHKETVPHGAMANVLGQMMPASIVSILAFKLLLGYI